LDALPSVNGISASQISPGDGVIVKPFVLWNVAVQKGAMFASCRRAPLHPLGKFREIFRRKLFDHLLNFLNLAHVAKLRRFICYGKFEKKSAATNSQSLGRRKA
jgi:hypothetical protein